MHLSIDSKDTECKKIKIRIKEKSPVTVILLCIRLFLLYSCIKAGFYCGGGVYYDIFLTELTNLVSS